MTFEFAAVTFPGLIDPTIAIAASRAKAIGIVDLTLVGDPQLAVDAVRTLARFGRHRCGVRLDPREEATADAVSSVLRAPVGLAVLTPADPDLLRRRAWSAPHRRSPHSAASPQSISPPPTWTPRPGPCCSPPGPNDTGRSAAECRPPATVTASPHSPSGDGQKLPIIRRMLLWMNQFTEQIRTWDRDHSFRFGATL